MTQKRIAIIGTGIAGITTAWFLKDAHDIEVFEKNDYIGGHTNTREARFGDVTVHADTGFMVFNKATYPHFTKLLEYLDIPAIKTDMSFGIALPHENFEFYSDSAFAKKSDFVNIRHWRILLDIVRFNRDSERVVSHMEKGSTLGELANTMHLSKDFLHRYLLPMAGAIWSTDQKNMAEYPARSFVTFFQNHGLLTPKSVNPFKMEEGRVQWYTIPRGAQTYVQKIVRDIERHVHLSRGVRSVNHVKGHIEIVDEQGIKSSFDAVVLACHPDQARNILSDEFGQHKKALAPFHYSNHDVVMHSDVSCMMKKKKLWPSWTYREGDSGSVELSYNMNKLQHIDGQYPTFVTLDPKKNIPEKNIFYQVQYEHPLFTPDTEEGQKQIERIQGKQGIYFCGAWLRYGFHEDGLVSAVRLSNLLGGHVPWDKKG